MLAASLNNIFLFMLLLSCCSNCISKKDKEVDTPPPTQGKSFFLFGTIYRRFRDRWMTGHNEPGTLYAGATFPQGSYYNCPTYACNNVPNYQTLPSYSTPNLYNPPFYPNSQYTQPQQQQQHQQSNIVIYQQQQQPHHYTQQPIPVPIPLHAAASHPLLAPSGPAMQPNFPPYALANNYPSSPLPSPQRGTFSTTYHPAHLPTPTGPGPLIGPSTACGPSVYACNAGK